ncbi:hypothetical protein PoB_003130200 [Plakobranchus ocellatus]|uniref:Uncharacterized protein n=1 Tax=Plakobranchus ocellatus TaxID=259542 RepID=A0AAV4ACZ1_9GAST|nr:hypothetical protein PoB_003130200 [Plakobranchus ocellatus]
MRPRARARCGKSIPQSGARAFICAGLLTSGQAEKMDLTVRVCDSVKTCSVNSLDIFVKT